MPTLDPITPPLHLHAFAGYGIELEYMIVDRETMQVRPMADVLLVDADGNIANEVDHDELAWSNELVRHVVELKTNGPARTLDGLGSNFHADLVEINAMLEPHGACLMPTAMHPLFDPDRETELWPFGQNEIYTAYNRIFDCRGHGWSNLQSMHINLPFADDAEFTRLHAAIRAILPLIPALSAASPIEQGRATGWLDTRLRYYRDNQREVPEISGLVVPEPVNSIADYHARILAPMYIAIAPYDADGVLVDDWLNSRAAIARFERQTIEIRIIDLQECPAADLAIARAVVALVQRLYAADDDRFQVLQALDTASLADMLFDAAERGASSEICDSAWLDAFGFEGPMRAGEIWRAFYTRGWLGEDSDGMLGRIIERGPLAKAILERFEADPSREAVVALSRELSLCLAENRLFLR